MNEEERIGLGLCRNTFPELFANKIAGVQPMSAPVGLAYAMRMKYSENFEQNRMNKDMAEKLEALGFGDEITDEIINKKDDLDSLWDLAK